MHCDPHLAPTPPSKEHLPGDCREPGLTRSELFRYFRAGQQTNPLIPTTSPQIAPRLKPSGKGPKSLKLTKNGAREEEPSCKVGGDWGYDPSVRQGKLGYRGPIPGGEKVAQGSRRDSPWSGAAEPAGAGT